MEMKGSLLFLFYVATIGFGYRVYEENLTSAVDAFDPYEKGFVGRIGDSRTPKRERVNPGAPLSSTRPNLFSDVYPRQNCAGMIGPLDDGLYYCTRKEYGYCDRRAGICVCFQGYTGEKCDTCTPEYFLNNGLCIPKNVCPNDCSGGGDCNYLTGECLCRPYRRGTDCSEVFCQGFDPLCIECHSVCTRCFAGHYLTSNGTCGACSAFDPRCTDCSEDECLVCTDPVLQSIKRSGRRAVDPPLPFDEATRQFPQEIEFGSQWGEAFDEAEPFFVYSGSKLLNETSQWCHQGWNMDDTYVCEPFPVSHRICGHAGTLIFSSPTYSIWENTSHAEITVVRTGGGMGDISVEYSVERVTAGPSELSPGLTPSADTSDFTPTAFYTSSQRLYMNHGTVMMSFQVTIHEDLDLEPDEYVRLKLRDPTNGAVLGSQHEALLTIHDSDEETIDLSQTTIAGDGLLGGIVGATSSVRISGQRYSGKPADNELFILELWDDGLDVSEACLISDEDGIANCSFVPERIGYHTLVAELATPGGLMGYYFENLYLEGFPLFNRVDKSVNFTWGVGPLTSDAADGVSIRWTGKVKAPSTENFTFYVSADDHCRLWIDRVLLLDRWDSDLAGSEAFGVFPLEEGRLHHVVLEYRDAGDSAMVRFLWSSASVPKEVIPPENLYTLRSIPDSPIRNVDIAPSSVNAEWCEGLGPALGPILISGLPYSMELVSRDRNGNFRGVDGSALADRFEVFVNLTSSRGESRDSPEIQPEVLYNSEAGLWYTTFTPRVSGVYSLSVTVEESFRNWQHIRGSPYSLTIIPGRTQPERCILSGAGLIGGVVGEEANVTMRTLDEAGNFRRFFADQEVFAGKIQLLQAVENSDFEFYTGSVDVELLGDGVFLFRYTVEVAGSYSLKLTGLDGMNLQGSPYTVYFTYADTGGSQCIAEGPGISSATVAVPTFFVVHSRDRFGNPRENADGDVVTVQLVTANTGHIVNGSPNPATADIVQVLYTAEKIGAHELHVKVNGEDIVDSPFAVTVKPGVEVGETSTAVGEALSYAVAGSAATFDITAKDAFKNVVPNEDAVFSVELIHDSEPDVAVVGSVLPLGDGVYQGKYTPLTSGQYSLSVRLLSGSPGAIEGSAFAVTVDPFYPNATMSRVWSDLLQGATTAGEAATVKMEAVDAYGNTVSKLDGNYEVFLRTLDGEELFLTVPTRSRDSNEVGVYETSFTPTVAGDFVLSVGLWRSNRLAADFFASTDFMLHKYSDYLESLDWNWVRNPSTASLSKNRFSIRWKGYLTAFHSEAYSFTILTNGFVRFWLDGELLIDAWFSEGTAKGTLSVSSLHPVSLAANKHLPIQLEFASRPGEPFIQVLWKSASTPSQSIPGDALWSHAEVDQSPYAVTIWPTELSLAHCILTTSEESDDALVEIPAGAAGRETMFMVRVADRYSNIRRVRHEHTVASRAFSIDGAEMLVGEVSDDGSGYIAVTLRPSKPGKYQVYVSVDLEMPHDDVGAHELRMAMIAEDVSVVNAPFEWTVTAG